MPFDEQILRPLLPAARRGDGHAILGYPPHTDLRAALSPPPEWSPGSYEKLLALYVAQDFAGTDAMAGVIYDFAEHTYFCHDDEGHALAWLNADLCHLYASEPTVLDEHKAGRYLEEALAGPDPEGIREHLAARVMLASLIDRLARTSGRYR